MLSKRIKLTLVAIHRWLGVPLSLFFALWFPSAIGMMYWDFPSVTPEDRLAHAAALDPSSIVIAPADALARTAIDRASDIRLNTFDGRPVYHIRADTRSAVVFADTGELRGVASAAMMRRAAARWTGRPEADARADAVTAVDQWTLEGSLRTLRPLWKFSFSDGQEVYVAGSTGDVVQATTRASRVQAYLGPVPHWLYFTPLRQHQTLWSSVVIWSSGIATIAAALGLVIGIWMSVPAGRVPYRGPKRWHAVIGLVFGVAAMTWAFSGMLSMDPFPPIGSTAPPARVRDPLRITAFSPRTPREAVDALAPMHVRELEWVSVLGDAAYLATLDDGTTRVVPMSGEPTRTFDVARLTRALSADGAAVTVRDRYDAYYLDRHHKKPLPVLRVASASDTYIDPATARIVGTYSGDWMNRWLYHGLHSLDFPWLYDHRPLWDLLVIACMLAGTALSVTSLVLAWRVVST